MYCIYSTRFALGQSSIRPVFISHVPVQRCDLRDTPSFLLLIPCDLATSTSTATLRLRLRHCDIATATATLRLLRLRSRTPLRRDHPSLLRSAYDARDTRHRDRGAPETLLAPSPTPTSRATSASRPYGLRPPFGCRFTYHFGAHREGVSTALASAFGPFSSLASFVHSGHRELVTRDRDLSGPSPLPHRARATPPRPWPIRPSSLFDPPRLRERHRDFNQFPANPRQSVTTFPTGFP